MNQNLTLSAEEIAQLKNAISTHVSRLYADADAYKKSGAVEAQMDCLAEIRKYESLKKKL